MHINGMDMFITNKDKHDQKSISSNDYLKYYHFNIMQDLQVQKTDKFSDEKSFIWLGE